MEKEEKREVKISYFFLELISTSTLRMESFIFFSLHFQGRVFRDINMPGTSPAERHALYVAMVTTLVQLHTLDWRDLGLEDWEEGRICSEAGVCVCVCVC